MERKDKTQMQNNFKDNFNHITFKQKPHKRVKESQGEYEGKYVASIKEKGKHGQRLRF